MVGVGQPSVIVHRDDGARAHFGGAPLCLLRDLSGGSDRSAKIAARAGFPDQGEISLIADFDSLQGRKKTLLEDFYLETLASHAAADGSLHS
jgi:hypothetical protein